MNRRGTRSGLTIVLIAMIAMLAGPLPAATAQSAGTSATLVSGTTFTWQDPWIDPSVGEDTIGFMQDATISIVNIEVFPVAEHTAESAATLDCGCGYTPLLDEPDGQGGHYQMADMGMLDIVTGEDMVFLDYTRAWVTEDGQWIVRTDLQSTVENFHVDLLSIPGSITIDGAPLWGDIDPAAIIARFESVAGYIIPLSDSSLAEAPVPDAPVSDTPAADEPVAVEPVSPDDILASMPADLMPAPVETNEASYTSDQFGYTIAWTDTWTPYEDGITADPDEGYDSYTLSSEGVGFGALNLYATAVDERYGPADYVDYWTSDDFLAGQQPEGTDVLLADSSRRSGAVVLVGPLSDDDPALWVTVYEIAVIDGELQVETSLLAPLEDFEVVYDDAQDSITLDGEGIIGFFSTDEILEALPAG